MKPIDSYLTRLASFEGGFPIHVFLPSLLADAGFTWTGYNDEVQCSTCGLTHNNWNENDDPIAIHKKMKCAFLNEIKNISYEEEPRRTIVYTGDDNGTTDIKEDATTSEPIRYTDVINLQKELSDTTLKRCDKNDSAETIMKNNNELHRQLTCQKCKTVPIDLLLLPCRHFVTCEACGESMDYCIYCNQWILGTAKAYIV